MTKDFMEGKIYRIVSGSGKQYIGSTTEKLSQRLARHRQYIKDKTHQCISSVQLLQEDPNCRIILIEDYPCQNSNELRAREQYWIDNMDCVNKNRALRTKEDSIQDAKKRCEEKREEIDEYKRQYFKKHYDICYYSILNKMFGDPEEKEERLKKKQEEKRKKDAIYRENHKEEISNYTKERYKNDEDFRNQVKQRAKEHRQKDETKERRREKYQLKKEEIQAKRRKRYEEDEEYRKKCIQRAIENRKTKD